MVRKVSSKRWRLQITWLILMLFCLPEWTQTQETADCSFNTMCTCVKNENTLDDENLQIVNCLDVPLYKMPSIPESTITQLEIVGARISSLEPDTIPSQIQALILSNNQIEQISEGVLSPSADSLTSVDLSHNQLDSVPFQAFEDLRNIKWINLHGNQISTITGDWTNMKSSLSTLFVGENDITEILGETQYLSSQAFTSLRQLKALIWLNLDGNNIHKIHKHSLPSNLKTLSVSYNFIEKFPLDIILTMPHLQWLYLRGNNIKSIPKYTFDNKVYLEKIDLAENYLTDFPTTPFNYSLVVRDLNLASNNFKSLHDSAFSGLKTRRIILAYNSLSNMDENVFHGIEDTLEYLDLDHNILGKIPHSLKCLKNLKYLYLSSNELGIIFEDSFSGFQNNLKALSLSNNKLLRIPKESLQNCKNLSYFNAGFNEIQEIDPNDFRDWGLSLRSLILNNNRLSFLEDRVFCHLPALKELSLNYNTFSNIENTAFFCLENLETLELTFSIDRPELPYEIFKELPNLQNLFLDHNNFYEINDNSFDDLLKLSVLNLEGNKLGIIKQNLFKSDFHSNLKVLRLSNNEINETISNTFNSLYNLQTILLTDNRIRIINYQSFFNMTTLTQIFLTHNMITTIKMEAFKILPALRRLDLQYNFLKEISFDIFKAVGNQLSLNLSHNLLTDCVSNGNVNDIRVLDMSNNNLTNIPSCLKHAQNLRKLFLDKNRLRIIETESLKCLNSIEKISIRYNGIVKIDPSSFYGLKKLQTLDLSYNSISNMYSAQFVDNVKLRSLNLRNNNLTYLPKDIFVNTVLEMIDLSMNSLNSIPSSSLFHVRLNLQHLSLNENNLEHLDITSFPDFPYLNYLDLNKNRLTILPDNAFISLNRLQSMDLSSNPIRANFKELLHYARSLRKLNLANVEITSTPQLPLPNLVHLNLSSNNLQVINRHTFHNLGNLKVLDLSNCNLVHIPTHIWSSLHHLKNLDLSHNPIKEIAVDSFHGLKALKILSINNLSKLQKFEGKSFSQLRILSKLDVQTFPSVKDFYEEFCYVLSHLVQLKVLKINFYEHELKEQLTCLSHKKLTNIEITGRNLRSIDHNTFANLIFTPSLSIKISNTLITALPSGLFSNMLKVPYLAIDLSHNMLTDLSPGSFYGNTTTWDTVGTSVIIGGLKLAGNRFRCGCHLGWLGHWLRRWTRENLQPYTTSVEMSLRIQEMSKEATCWDSNLERHIPIVKLPPVDMNCQASALSSEGHKTRSDSLVIFFVIFFGNLIFL